MKIKIGDKIYDSEKQPVMIIISEEEKKQISNMAKEATKYCIYPDNEEWTSNNFKNIKQWMRDV